MDRVLHSLFEEQVKSDPDWIAISFGDRSYTYGELNSLSNRYARFLIKEGVRNETFVGIYMNRSIEMIAAMLAVLKAGATYVPLDPKQPDKRINLIVEHAKMEYLISDKDTKGSITSVPREICFADLQKELQELDASDPNVPVSPEQIAYTIFTSGSTGVPKGVMIRHSNVVALVDSMPKLVEFSREDRVLALATITFDMSILEIFMTLSVGAQIILSDYDTSINAFKLQHLCETKHPTIMQATPATWYMLLDSAWKGNDDLQIICGGEYWGLALAEQLVDKCGKLWNAYGPTEATVWVSASQYHKGDSNVNLGNPFEGTKMYILNEKLEPVPDGESGELYIAGPQVGAGYFNNPDKTKEAFIHTDKFEDGLLYKTGDRVRLNAEGKIEYIERVDFQVKIRGFRIELGDIENNALMIPEVKRAAAVVKTHKDDKAIALYVVGDQNAIDKKRILSELRENLPYYMIPQIIEFMDELPMNDNRKVDRKKLESLPIDQSSLCNEYVAPRTETEKKLCAIYCEVLDLEKVGVTDNFFEMGGHSLRATRLINRIEAETGRRIELKEIFDNATPEQLAALILNGDTTEYIPIPKAEEKEYYPMSSTQKRTYLICQMDADGILYNMPEFRILKGNVDPEALKSALQKMFDRHEIFRTQFIMVNGEPMQKIVDHMEADFEFIKDTTTPEEQLRIRFIRPFDLSKGPLIRVRLIDRGDHYLYCLDMHHIVGDGVTSDLFNMELSALYNQEELAPLTHQYKDYSEWMQTRDLSDQAKFWKEQFEDEIPVLDMPLDNARGQERSYRGDMIYRPVGKELFEKIRELTSKTGTTNFMVLMSAAMVLLSKYSRQEDIVIGTPVSARVHKDTEEMFGMFVNTVAMRGKPEGKKTCLEFLEEMKELSFKSLENQEYPFEELVNAVDVKRDPSRNPLFDVMLVLQNTENLNLTFHDVESKWVDSGSTVAKFDLCFSIEEHPDDFLIALEYCTDLYTKESAEEIVSHFKMILTQLTMDPSMRIEEIATVDQKEKGIIINEFNNTRVHGLEEKTFVELFEEQVRKTPDQAAVIYKGETLTYSELNAKANALAYKLREIGVGRNDFVVLYTERSLEMIIGIYGIIKAGGAYVPMDPTYPEDRITYMLEDADPKAVLTYKTTIRTDIPVIDLGDNTNYSENSRNPEQINTARDLIYCIYTSGTTGKPKGVMIEHGNLVNFISVDKTSEFQHCMKEMCTLVYSSNKVIFDITMQEIFLPICNGIGMILADNEWLQFSEEDVETIERNHGIGLITTPTKLRNCMLSDERNVLKKIDFYMIGAENLPLELIRSLRELNPKAVIYNGYGPTETTCGATYYLCNENTRRISIGKPMVNTQVYIMNGKTLCGIGVPGELCIAGAGVARGYVKLPEMTAEKFVGNPFGEGRMYHTGDLARWLPDGNIEYLGRIDEQVKIRGFRIELGEIESRIREIENVKDCAVIARDDASGEKAIYAYVVGDGDINISDIREKLGKNLPDYMIPAYMMQIESIPMTRNGKLDKHALPEIKGGIKREYVAPRNEMESLICKIYSNVLNLEKVGIHDSFFELGGHSLRVIKLINAIDRELGKRISLNTVFGNPRVENLARYLSTEKVNTTDLIPQVDIREEYEMSSSEKRIYIVSELDETGLAYNVALFYEINGGLDKERFENAVAKLVKRHEPLRTSFHMQGEKAVKRIHDTVEIQVEWETKEEIGKGIVDGFVRPFDLGKAPLFRLKVVEVQGKTYLLTDCSHIISDGGSAQIFIKDLIALYKGEELAPLRVQYKDYSEWMRLVHYEDLKEQKAYWLNEFKDEPMVLNLQTDYPRPAVQSFEGDNYTKDIDPALSERIIQYAKENDITENMLLMGAFALLLSKYTAQDDIVVGTPVSGRMNYETEAMMGVFINTLAIRSRIDKTKSVTEYMRQMKDVFVKAYDNQEYPFEDLVDQVVSKRDMSRNPLFDVMFTYYSEQEVNIGTDEDGFALTDLDEEGKVAQFDITLSVSRYPETFQIDFEYCTKLFRKDTMMRMADSYLWLLTQIVSGADPKIQELNVVDPVTEEKLLTTFNCEAKNYDFEKTLYEKFEEFAIKQPEKIAVIYGDRKLTYREVNEKANRIAHYLIAQGIQKDDVVGVLLERSPKFIESVLGIWKAGGAYMPLDSKHPVDRKLGLLEDSKAFGMITKFAIVEPELTEQFSGNGGKVLCLDDAKEILEKESVEDPMLTSDIHQLAYVLFTSGSTGKPKGVMIEHLGMLNHIYAEADDLGLTENLVFAQNANQCFDVSVWQFFGALALGGTTAIYSNDCILNIPEFISRLNADQVNMLEVVPSYLSVVMDYVESDHLNIDQVKHLLVTGEAVKPEIVNRWFSLSDKQEIINAYGPAEASDDVVQAHITKPVETTTVPIGKPLPNVNVYILDQDLNLCPIGVEGEICIGGVGVGRGYVSNEEKTRESFLTITINGKEERIYKTGDKAKWAENGEIIFLGRDDFQVKIRGFRIELEEIEKQIIKVDGVKEVVVAPVEKQLLAAYFVATKEVTSDEIKKVITQTLPEYMVPAFYVQLDKMPLSSNGKIDRKALPEIDVTESRTYVAPRNETEEKLCSIFEEVLKTTGIGIDDNFFENGGHSLRATTLNNRIEQTFGVRLLLRDIFNNTTVRQLAERISQTDLSEDGTISASRKRLYRLSQEGKATTNYNIPNILLIENELDPLRVELIFKMIVAKYAALRTGFEMQGNNILQVIRDEMNFEIHYEEISDEQKEIDRVVRRFVRPFKLSIAPLFRVKVCRLADEKYMLLTDIHRIICDEISNETILSEFMKLYWEDELPKLKYSYLDYAQWDKNKNVEDIA